MGCGNSTAAYDGPANKKTAGAKIICPGGRLGTSRLFARPRLFQFSGRLFALTYRSLLGNGRHVNRQTVPCQAFFELLWGTLTQVYLLNKERWEHIAFKLTDAKHQGPP
jgi:hypothetical protein